ncbi:MAG: 8-oxo-dGTP diphosphatase [Clostridiales bacterium]|nr:8-oxo-dGTP diphosphatase [Clostridiales bacterium]
MKKYQYTICFIKRGKKILMLNRENAGFMGRWNGVGGRFEDGETPTECILREVHEETGITLADVTDCGSVTWMIDSVDHGGMHIFFAEVEEDFVYMTPRGTEEGILDWKHLDWIMHPENSGVAENIPIFLPYMLNDMKRYNHHCTWIDKQMVEIETLPIE